jgi:hypothetical protein
MRFIYAISFAKHANPFPAMMLCGPFKVKIISRFKLDFVVDFENPIAFFLINTNKALCLYGSRFILSFTKMSFYRITSVDVYKR